MGTILGFNGRLWGHSVVPIIVGTRPHNWKKFLSPHNFKMRKMFTQNVHVHIRNLGWVPITDENEVKLTQNVHKNIYTYTISLKYQRWKIWNLSSTHNELFAAYSSYSDMGPWLNQMLLRTYTLYISSASYEYLCFAVSIGDLNISLFYSNF